MENKPEKNVVPFSQYIISLICVAIISTGGTIIVLSKLFPIAETTNKEELSKVNELYSEIMTNYVGEISSDELIEGALKGMTSALDDPYSVYVSKDESESLNSTITGTFEGIGATMAIVDNYPTIMEDPAEGTPSAKAGLKKDDVVIKVDGESTENKEISEVVNEIRGEKGTDVTLTIKRGDEEMEVPVTRDTINSVSVTSELDKTNPTIGKITVSSFSNNTFEEFKTAITSLRKEGAKEFVVDLRDNPGGVLSQVEMMSSMFLEDGKTIVKFEDSSGNITETVASKELDGEFKVTEPVVVLVNGNSASASEVFAAALQESADVPVVGQTTYGKGTVQQVKPFGDESEIKLTVNKWLTPKGNWVNETGLTPTVEVTYPDYYNVTTINDDTTYLEGNSGSAIKNIQIILNALGYYNADISNSFSPELTTSVKQFQTDKGLTVNGVVDEMTGTVIFNALKEMVQGDDIIYNKGIESLK